MAVPNVTVARSAQLVKPVPLLEGTRTDPAGKAVRNVILLAVPDDEYELIRPHLELLELPRHFVMHEQGEKLDFAYFPNEGMVSLVILVKDGKSVEVGLVGKEGMTGTPLAVGVSRGPSRAIVQIPGSGRPSVTIAAGMLERAGAIENTRGTIRVLNRKALEKAACECYDVIQNFNGGLGLR